jgi:hypothetical protein
MFFIKLGFGDRGSAFYDLAVWRVFNMKLINQPYKTQHYENQNHVLERSAARSCHVMH